MYNFGSYFDYSITERTQLLCLKIILHMCKNIFSKETH